MKNHNQIPNENIVIFVNPNPDKRQRFFNFFKNEYCNIREFKEISSIELKSLIKKEFDNIKITDNEITFLINKVGTNLYQITSEIDKLKEYCMVHQIDTITTDLIENISF